MAQSLRLRRALTSVSSFLNCHRSLPSLLAPTPLPQSTAAVASPGSSSLASHLRFLVQSRGLTGSGVLSVGERQLKLYKEGDEITEDTILFEGCDYNHWLITVDFPKDPKPSPEEMVATYERICAQGLNISIEEAKQKMYACSTTTYQGFQAVMTEEESEKFKDIPGVVFVLPDSYIDPQNKEYGGDKYINGMIIPRPPPVQFQKQRGGRPRRNFDQPRYDQQGGPNPNTQYNQQGYMQGGGRNYGPQQNYPPQQNYGTTHNIPPQQNYGPSQNTPLQQNYGPPQNTPPHQNYGPPQNIPPQQNYVPPQNIPPQRSYGPPQNLPPQQNHGSAQNFSPQQNFGSPQNFPPQQNYGPPGQGDRMPMNNRNFGPGGRDPYQTNRADPVPSYQNNYNQGNYYQDQTGFPHGGHRDYGPPGQRDFSGDNRNYSTQAGNYGQGANPVYGQGYSSEGQSVSQQRN